MASRAAVEIPNAALFELGGLIRFPGASGCLNLQRAAPAVENRSDFRYDWQQKLLLCSLRWGAFFVSTTTFL
jgi:hypothetical protein